MKGYRIYIAVLVVALAALVLYELSKPQPLDWRQTYSKNDKIPYGEYVLYDVLPHVFPSRIIEVISDPLYNTLHGSTYSRVNYIIISDLFTGDHLDVKELLAFVHKGNTVFIAAHYFGDELADSLGLSTSYNYEGLDSVSINFTSPHLQSDNAYVYKRGTAIMYFDEMDAATTTALGVNSIQQVNYIQVQHGDGYIYLHTVPLAFTNYYAVDSANAEYIFKALSYLPAQQTLWDEYYKGRTEASTPLRYLLSQEALQWAYAILIISVFLFMIFRAKRTQRIIPVINPLKNTTLEFAETVGRLYFQAGNHTDIANKKIRFFLEFVRNRFHVDTRQFNDTLYTVVSERSGVTKNQVKLIFNRIELVQRKRYTEEDEFLTLNNEIEQFYRTTLH